MRIVAFEDGQGEPGFGIVDGDAVIDLSALDPETRAPLAAVVRSGRLDGLLARRADAPRRALADVTVTAPIDEATKIICVGLNYADHVAEMGRQTPERPVVFTRFPDSLVGPGAPLETPARSTAFDYEGELAIVIGREVRDVDPATAAEAVLGYTLVNDGSLRDYQRHTHQFGPGKNFPRSGSIGPDIVTADEFAVGAQRIRTRVNGETVQDSTLDQLIFDPAQLVAYCSEWTTLRPGDVIATGTPGGVGDSFDPPRYLRPGDVVEVEVEGLGVLRNPVR